ncbi:MAG: hypothetical protein Tp152SUR00d2C52646391_51 [Prokaryotic dsDNA virus sp.]|nr:MAG: hypothetical protein Tp152SUR00d2C52646391_51 [Prokaryotic dsDNA virus sp.]|tara:strand:- start:22 stop:174 length:153 start_codon:yes stop_codon:yes gene_type:complete
MKSNKFTILAVSIFSVVAGIALAETQYLVAFVSILTAGISPYVIEGGLNG